MLSPADDLPIHQLAEPVSVVATGDRNFYDRYYFNLFDRGADLFLTAGLGQYPNLGVVDGFVAVTAGRTQHVLRASRELTDNRMDTSVGPIAVEVIEGLRRLRLRAGGDDTAIAVDVMWAPAIDAFLEARHVNRRGPRLTTDTCRFAQTGFWEGTLRVGDTVHAISPDRWWGGRDRSWGIRPVGEPEPPGRRVADGPGGFLWLYCTMQFDAFSIVCILQEDRAGGRTLEQAVRIWPSGSDRQPELLGSVDHDLRFVEGSRQIEDATLTFTPTSGEPLVVTVTPVGASYLSLGTGYGNELDWRHGMYQGPLVVQERMYDLDEPEIARRTYGLIDNLARFEIDGAVGHGLFENAVLGPNDRYGFGGRT